MKILFGLIVAVTLLFGGYIIMDLKRSGSTPAVEPVEGNNVSVVDGTQIITLQAKGGYVPRVSVADPGLPTILRVSTNGTFDCSATIRIPSLQVSQTLPMNGTTDISLGTLSTGIIQGNCGMGMYPFQINVQS